MWASSTNAVKPKKDPRFKYLIIALLGRNDLLLTFHLIWCRTYATQQQTPVFPAPTDKSSKQAWGTGTRRHRAGTLLIYISWCSQHAASNERVVLMSLGFRFWTGFCNGMNEWHTNHPVNWRRRPPLSERQWLAVHWFTQRPRQSGFSHHGN